MARHYSSKLFCCFLHFLKSFDLVLWEAMFQSLKDIGGSEILVVVIMGIYGIVLGHLRTAHELSDFIRSTIEVKQGCPLLPTLFGIHIDKLEAFLHEHIQRGDGCLLHHVLISMLLFANDVVTFASTPKGLQR